MAHPNQSASRADRGSFDFLILAPLLEEFVAVRRMVEIVGRMEQAPALLYECYLELPTRKVVRGAVAKLENTGRVEAAVLATYLFAKFGVRLLVLTGIAGGIRPKKASSQEHAVSLGDIVIANVIIDTEFAKTTEWGEIARDRFFEINPELVAHFHPNRELPSILRAEIRRQAAERGAQDTFVPRIRIGPVISSNKVLAYETGSVTAGERVARSGPWGLPIAVEMEGIGVAVAASRLGLGSQFLMIRAISDYANREKSDDESIWRVTACHNAAIAAIEFIKAYAAKMDYGVERWELAQPRVQSARN